MRRLKESPEAERLKERLLSVKRSECLSEEIQRFSDPSSTCTGCQRLRMVCLEDSEIEVAMSLLRELERFHRDDRRYVQPGYCLLQCLSGLCFCLGFHVDRPSISLGQRATRRGDAYTVTTEQDHPGCSIYGCAKPFITRSSNRPEVTVCEFHLGSQRSRLSTHESRAAAPTMGV
jgi:hypothetical protein